jgi:2-polyprenyl-3-methyl-5-hydroxy-6-metoxy-1,4-benzoquinol methylase
MKYDHVKYWNARAYTHKGYGKVLPPSMTASEVACETDKQVEIIKRCCPDTHSKILDAGCGIGRISCELAANGYSVCGVDASVKMIGVAKRAATNVEYEVADLKELPFPDNEFDLVFELSVLLHVPDTIIESVINEFKRVSKDRMLIFPSAVYFKDASYMFYRSTERYETLFEPFMLIHTELVESGWGTAKAMLFEKEKRK